MSNLRRAAATAWQHRRYWALLSPLVRSHVGYFGWAGHGNLGDDLLLITAQRLFPALRLVEWPDGPAALTIARGPAGRSVAGAILGGGTLVGTPRYRAGLSAVGAKAGMERVVIFGAGVEDPAFSTGAGIGREELEAWKPLLVRGRATVRGRRSAELLSDLGCDVSVIGDPVLWLGPQLLTKSARCEDGRNTLMISLIDSSKVWGGGVADSLAGIVAYSRDWVSQGGHVLLAPMAAADLPLHQELGKAVEGSELLAGWHLPSDYVRRAADASLVISSRLHGSVVATSVGTPNVLIGYGPKSIDFAESVNKRGSFVRIDEVDRPALVSAAAEAQETASLRSTNKAVEDLVRRIEAEAAAVSTLLGA